MIDLHIHASTPEELVQTLKALSGGTVTCNYDAAEELPPRGELQTIAEQPVAEPEDAPPVSEAQDSSEVPWATDSEPAEDPAEDKTEGPVVKMEDARAALNALREAKGSAAVRELLQRHNVKSFIDIPASEYAAVIKEAKYYE